MATLTRTIRFYRLLVNGTFISVNDAKALFTELDTAINSKNTLNRYYPIDSDVRMFVHKIDVSGNPLKIVFAKTQTHLLPSKEKKQKIEPLDLVDDPDQLQGLTHKTHICVFRDGIVGVESHQNCTTSNQICSLLHHFTGQPVSMNFLPNKNYATKLAKLGEITMFKIKMGSELLSDLKKSKNLLLSKVGLIDPAGAEEVEVILKVNGQKATSALSGIKSAITSLNQFRGGGKLNGIEVKGRKNDTSKIEHLDLIDSAIIASENMVTVNSKSRDVKESSAFAAIALAYRNKADEIETSVNGENL